MLTTWIALILSVLFIHLRDLDHIYQVFLRILFFVTPLFYDITFLENETAKKLIMFNPLAYLLNCSRSIIIYDRFFQFEDFILFLMMNTIMIYVSLKIFRKAEEAGQTPQEFVDEIAALYQQLAQECSVSNDDFIRTTDAQRHWPAAQKLWQILLDQNLLEKRQYSGLYCVGCERYIKENELNDQGECPDHLKKPEPLESENYFFKLSKSFIL